MRGREMTAVKVDLGARGYEVVIEDGLLDRAGERLAPFARELQPWTAFRPSRPTFSLTVICGRRTRVSLDVNGSRALVCYQR